MKVSKLMKGGLNHFKTITTHKIVVMKGCFAVGLYKQGLLHDMSKYTLTEFIPGMVYYQGTRSPNNAEREDKGYSSAWLHHKGRNKHHYEYWIDYISKAEPGKPIIVGCKMPVKYVVEMFVDRVAACKVYNGKDFKRIDPWNYYAKGRTAELLHEDTRKLLEKLLKMYARCGEEYTNAYIRKKILHNASRACLKDKMNCKCDCNCSCKNQNKKGQKQAEGASTC